MLSTIISGLHEYNPNELEFPIEEGFDEEEDVEDEDVVLLTNEAIPREIGVKKGRRLFNDIPDQKLREMEDDDDIIDYFLNN